MRILKDVKNMDKKVILKMFAQANLVGLIATGIGYLTTPSTELFSFATVWLFIVINAGLIAGIYTVNKIEKK